MVSLFDSRLVGGTGVGEYVDEPAEEEACPRCESPPLFSVSSNAVVVNEASPRAIAAAVLHVASNPALGESIGREGRRTVLRYFTLERQMEQYSQLYSEIAHRGLVR